MEKEGQNTHTQTHMRFIVCQEKTLPQCARALFTCTARECGGVCFQGFSGNKACTRLWQLPKFVKLVLHCQAMR